MGTYVFVGNVVTSQLIVSRWYEATETSQTLEWLVTAGANTLPVHKPPPFQAWGV